MSQNHNEVQSNELLRENQEEIRFDIANIDQAVGMRKMHLYYNWN